ncbi:MAG: UvrD-helicase domain-containing protein [Tahibacter sp.]
MSVAGAPEIASPADWRQLSLDPGGRCVIEASAGTGKTWTISVLYVRLLLENQLDPKQIVVTTFTDAAAQELRERIRARLLWAEARARCCVDNEQQPAAAALDKPDEQWLQDRWMSRDAGVDSDPRIAAREDLNRLRLAQAALDQAPIGTLHSVCRKVLADFPFDSGSAFGLGELVSSAAVQAELFDDLWRRLTQSTEQLSVHDRVWLAAGRRSLERHLRKALAPGIQVAVIPDEPITALLGADYARLLRDWLGDGAQFTRSNSALKARLWELTQFIEIGDLAAHAPIKLADALADPLEKHLRPAAIAAGTHERVIEFARRVAIVLPLLADALRSHALRHYVAELREQCQQRLAASAQLTFDELIERVFRALPAQGSVLADRLFDAWPVALVDEFQDTDALQYGILDRIYRARDSMPRGRLVMIGDPKQAIYRFRGGDIDAYLEARESATSALHLDTNFRSSAALVAAFNAFYAAAGETLSARPDHPIRYAAVFAGPSDLVPVYTVGGVACRCPLQFHYWSLAVPDDADGRRDAALDACANQIVELLGGHHCINGKPVQPGDIAVLLPGNVQIGQLRERLRDRGVPCVSSARSSVFGSDWARELQIVLYAVLHPRDDTAVRAALASRLLGRSYAELRALRDDAESSQAEAAVFEQWRRLWHSRGVLAVVQAVIGAAAPRLFASGESERALTDLRHLAELLQARSEELTGPEQLLAWLAIQRDEDPDAAGEAADDMQLRIESDAARVRLLTLHGSKGLEFPIVLLPLMWANRQNVKDTIAIVHDAATRQRVLGFDAESRSRYHEDGQDERFRLLYVALTRAKYACHVYALPPDRPADGSGKSADADPQRAPLDVMLARWFERGGPIDHPAAHVLWSDDGWRWPMARYRPATAGNPAQRAARVEPTPADFEYKYSFSSLTQKRRFSHLDEEAATDEGAEPAVADLAGLEADAIATASDAAQEEPIHAQLDWLAPVAGAEFGNALHAIFEHRRIGVPMREQHELVRRCLREEGVRLRDIPFDALMAHLAERVQVTLDTPLFPNSAGPVSLGALRGEALRTEMEFHFVLDDVSMQRLRRVCEQFGDPSLVPVTAAHTLRGLMNGKIDLVFANAQRFHVLDYKSNRLGLRLSDYAPAQLVQAMDRHQYRFQALLYTVALDRYLRQRVHNYRRGTHLGAAIYLFVRAVGIVPGAGIWMQRFDDDLIDAVDRVLAGDDRGGAA